jgi:hypothetical protein
MDTNGRLKSASNAGVRLRKVSELSGISYFRIVSIVTPDSYRGATVLTEEEQERVMAALDKIKSSF